jgi:hypothetical protein
MRQTQIVSRDRQLVCHNYGVALKLEVTPGTWPPSHHGATCQVIVRAMVSCFVLDQVQADSGWGSKH